MELGSWEIGKSEANRALDIFNQIPLMPAQGHMERRKALGISKRISSLVCTHLYVLLLVWAFYDMLHETKTDDWRFMIS